MVERWSTMRVRLVAACALLLTACTPSGNQPPLKQPVEPAPVVMPDLVGLLDADASEVLGALAARSSFELEWGRPVAVRCSARPESVVRQSPPPGTVIDGRTHVVVRLAALDLAEFRGPCAPSDGDLGPVHGRDAALARAFYRFAVDPSVPAPFASGEVLVAIEDRVALRLGPGERQRLTSWQIHEAYAEASGPFSALDLVASSGGYYELHPGVLPTCPTQTDDVPRELAGLRPLTLTTPAGATTSCMEWWGVTLFLDAADRIAGVALRMGSP
jgi:hypothetical protein